MATKKTVTQATKKTVTQKPASGGAASVPPAKRSGINPVITSVAPSNLGLKIGVRYADKPDRCGFLPIIGWASVGNYIEAGTAALTPVIKGPANRPALASPATVKGFVGLFPVEATVADILARPRVERPV